MQCCPKCHANVEGLTHHCDCCGALLNPHSSFFTWHTFMVEASGDLYFFTNKVFNRLDQIDTSQYWDVLQAIEVNLFCYPEQIVLDEGIKSGAHFSVKKKKMTLKVVMDYKAYICMNGSQKEHMVIEALQSGFQYLEKKAERSRLNAAGLIAEINKHLSLPY